MSADLFGEQLPRPRCWQIDYEIRETPATGRAQITADTAQLAVDRLRTQIRAEDPEFWEFCKGPTLDILGVRALKEEDESDG